ncbi:unnamed protein product [Vicia faba]|uniref:Pentatricopeptide repeat-containing protein n=1 Tax=Vicia faba TaxID=3906 RepID=A0AAV1B2D3_VICFA|nr:unnamed protein product [Vicia faba]
MMRMYVQMGRPNDALNMLVEMIHSGWGRPDNFTYSIVIKACSELFFDMGVGVHRQALKYGFDRDVLVQNSLLAMCMVAGEKEAARLTFDLMLEPTVLSWKSLINGYF